MTAGRVKPPPSANLAANGQQPALSPGVTQTWRNGRPLVWIARLESPGRREPLKSGCGVAAPKAPHGVAAFRRSGVGYTPRTGKSAENSRVFHKKSGCCGFSPSFFIFLNLFTALWKTRLSHARRAFSAFFCRFNCKIFPVNCKIFPVNCKIFPVQLQDFSGSFHNGLLIYLLVSVAYQSNCKGFPVIAWLKNDLAFH